MEELTQYIPVSLWNGLLLFSEEGNKMVALVTCTQPAGS